MLVGKDASYNYNITKLIEKNLDYLFLDNSEGVFSVIHDNYTFTICFKRRGFVSFDVKRKADPVKRWVVKEVVVDYGFVDYATSINNIRERFKKEAEQYDDNRYYDTISFDDLKNTLRYINRMFASKTKDEIRQLIHSLEWSYWLVDEALEREVIK